MDGSTYNVEKFLSQVSKKIPNAEPESDKYKATENCINESKYIIMLHTHNPVICK